MNKFLKYGLLAAGGVVLLLAGIAAYLAATFNPNDYKPQIIKAVKDSKQRTLVLDGDIKLTFFPSIGADLGKVSLSEFNSEKEFVSVERAHVSLALLPLLSKRLVVDEVAVNGLKATLVKYKDGKTNIDDLTGKEAAKEEGAQPAQPVQFDIASVRIENTELGYRDEAAGTQYALKNLNLKTGRIANGVPSKIDFSASIQANKPKLDLAAQMKTTLTFDLEKNSYRVSGLDLQAQGAVLDISNLVVKASGDASANLPAQEFTANKLLVSASGLKGRDKFEAKLDMPALNLTKDKYTSDKVELDATLDGALGNIVASLALPGLEGNAQSFKSNIALDIDVKQAEQAFKAKLTSSVYGNIEVQQLNLSNLTLAVSATGDKLPNKSVSSEMKGSMQVDAGRQSVQANLSGGLLQSQIAAKLAVNNFSNPAIRFDVDVDQFDADLYMPKAADAGAAKTETAAAAPEQPLDLSALNKLNLVGGIRIGALKAANVKLTQVRLDLKARNGQLDINPLSASLYQGGFTGSVSVNAQQATPSFTINENLNGINLGALLKDAANLDMVEGKGSVALNLSTQGNTVSALKKAVSGKMTLNVSNGVFKQAGKSYAGEVKGNVQIDGGKQNLQANVSGNLQQSKFTAKVALHDFDDPAIHFDVDVDQLDADQYLPKSSPTEAKKPAAPEQPFDLSALKKLNAEGGLRIGSFKLMNLKLAQVRLDMKAHKGVVNVNPLSANLYQGSITASADVNAQQAVPGFTLNGNLSGIAIAPLVKDLMDLDALEGKGNVTLNLRTQGDTVSALKKGLNGDAALNLANGAIKGINLTKLIQNAQTLGKGSSSQTLGVNKDEKTEFSEFQASFKVNNGVAHNDDLSVKSQLLRITGGGDINLGTDSLNYTAQARLQKTQNGGSLLVPVQLSGTYTDLKYKLDYTAMLEDLARQKIEAKKEEVMNKAKDEVKTKVQDELKKGLKGLFK